MTAQNHKDMRKDLRDEVDQKTEFQHAAIKAGEAVAVLNAIILYCVGGTNTDPDYVSRHLKFALKMLRLMGIEPKDYDAYGLTDLPEGDRFTDEERGELTERLKWAIKDLEEFRNSAAMPALLGLLSIEQKNRLIKAATICDQLFCRLPPFRNSKEEAED